jgi:hypothetical protein
MRAVSDVPDAWVIRLYAHARARKPIIITDDTSDTRTPHQGGEGPRTLLHFSGGVLLERISCLARAIFDTLFSAASIACGPARRRLVASLGDARPSSGRRRKRIRYPLRRSMFHVYNQADQVVEEIVVSV